jgi:deoxyribodipyrimidine photo-lyase
MVDERRVRALNNRAAAGGAVVYSMSRDQRVSDNWAFLYAQEKALERKVSLYVIFNLFRISGRANTRQYNFMFAGLKEVEQNLASLNIPFFVLSGLPIEVIPKFVKKYDVGEVVVDFSPRKLLRDFRAL